LAPQLGSLDPPVNYYSLPMREGFNYGSKNAQRLSKISAVIMRRHSRELSGEYLAILTKKMARTIAAAAEVINSALERLVPFRAGNVSTKSESHGHWFNRHCHCLAASVSMQRGLPGANIEDVF